MKKYPFKFLSSYNENDTDIFFGRDDEIAALYEMIFQTSILLVYGASGTGKTSLIQCGLAGKFKPYEWLPLMIRRGNNINASLEKKLMEAAGDDGEVEDVTTENPAKKLTGLPGLLRNVYLNNFRPIYLIFDQFEELYVLGTRAEQQQFIQSVKAILNAEQQLKMIFSIREEYLGYLYEFEKEVPQLLRKKLRVEAMTLDKVNDIMSGINKANTNVKIQADEVEKDKVEKITAEIFERLKGKAKTLTIQLPYLQVFLDKIYLEITHDESRKADALITIDILNRIGDIGDVLRNFLEEQVKKISVQLSAGNSNVTTESIWKILSPFATLEGTKEPISKKELAEKLPDINSILINNTVEEFKKSRIINYSENGHFYELAHDSLASRIAEKRSDEEIAVLEVQRLIKSQMLVKKEARGYLSAEQLSFIKPFLKKFTQTNEETKWIKESEKHYQEELAKIKKRLRTVYLLLGFALVAIVTAIFFWVNANSQKQEADKQKQIALHAKDSTKLALDQANKLIKVFYFYKNRFGLTYGKSEDSNRYVQNVYYYIDKNGDRIRKLGEWDLAGQFDDYTGFNKVQIFNEEDPTENYMIDTSGNSYRSAYELKNVISNTQAIEVNTFVGSSFNLLNPAKESLQVLIWYNLEKLPPAIAEFKNLKTLILNSDELKDLPAQLGELKNLTYLRLEIHLHFADLPPEISNLKNLKTFIIDDNEMNAEEQEKVRQLLPGCNVEFN